jgi:hypothetical protein
MSCRPDDQAIDSHKEESYEQLLGKVRDLFIPHSQPIEAMGVTPIQDPNCAKCHGGKCSFLIDFILFHPYFADRNRGTNTYYSMWQCPTCGRYYRREWITDWRSPSLAPEPDQYIFTYVVGERPARRILDMVKKCPDLMTRKREGCNRDLHSTLELSLSSVPHRWSSYPERKKTNSWIVSISREERMPTFRMGLNVIKHSINRRRQPCG